LKIFINDIPVNLTDTHKIKELSAYDLIINGANQKIVPKELLDDVLIQNASPEKVDELLHLMTDKKFKNVDSITFSSDAPDAMIKFVKKKFNIIEAAGGVVEKNHMTLLIYRKGRWDFPKGKRDKGEKKRACAVREVEEETGVKVAIEYKIGHTWHTYIQNKKYVLKKTHWYAMKCIDDALMAPQQEEDIEDVKWMNLQQMRSALYSSYRSIRFVIQEYHRLLKDKELNSTN
jgi:8-oxo-dGTP pyrophosphatase MutT (NUDIX family)